MFKEKCMYTIDYDDLEEIIQLVYGHDFSVVADQEWGNYEDHRLTLYKDDLELHEEIDLIEYINTDRGSYLLPDLMQDMCNFDILPEGTWLIQVFW